MTKKYRHGLVPLSADPVTYGHIDLVTRAAALCEQVTVYVSHNDHKAGQYLFSIEDRTGLVVRALAHLAPMVRVVAGDILLTDTFLEVGCDVLVRGIRNAADEAYEDEQLAYHALVYPPITGQVMYLRARPELALVSSSLVKAFVAHGVDVSRMVPVYVKALLEERIAGRHLIGVTGEIASGKSTVARALVAACNAAGVPALHVDVDSLSRAALFGRSSGGDVLRADIAMALGQPELFTGTRDEVLARFRAVFFSDALRAEVRERVHALVRPHVERLYRKATIGFRGVIFYEWAQLVEMDMLGVVNNTVVLLESSNRAEFAKLRGVETEQYEYVRTLQQGADKKAATIEARLRADGFGCLVQIKNEHGMRPEDLAAQALAKLREVGAVPGGAGGGAS